MMYGDKLSADASMAREIGISYGKYKALTYDSRAIERRKERQIQEKLDAGWIGCEWCGELFKPRNKCNRYCCPECADRGWKSNNKDKIRRYKKRSRGGGSEQT